MVGAEGVAIYSYAYTMFALFLEIIGLGIPQGMKKIIARAKNISDYYARLILKKMCLIVFLAGIVGFILINLIAPIYITISLLDNNVLGIIQTLSFALIIIPVVLVLRGYFEGIMDLKTVAISTIIESISRVIIIMGITYILLQNNVGNPIKYACIGVSVGGIFSLGYLLRRVKKNEVNGFGKIERISLWHTLKVTIPFLFLGISGMVYRIVDSLFFNLGMLRYGISNPNYYFGIYSFESYKLIMIPIAIISGLSTSIIPQMANKDKRVAIIKEALILFFIIFIPVTLLMLLYHDNIYNILYNNAGEKIFFWTILIMPFLAIDSLIIYFISGTDLERILYFSISAGIAVKCLLTYYLISRFSFYGAILSTCLGYFTTIIINVFYLNKAKYISYRFVLQMFNRITIVAIILINIFNIINYFITVTSLFTTLLYLGVSVGLYMAIYLPIVLKWCPIIPNKHKIEW